MYYHYQVYEIGSQKIVESSLSQKPSLKSYNVTHREMHKAVYVGPPQGVLKVCQIFALLSTHLRHHRRIICLF